MRQFTKRRLLTTAACMLALASAHADAQTQDTCGCAFINDQPPHAVSVVYAGKETPVAAGPDTLVHTGDVIKVTPESSGVLVCDNVQGRVTLRRTPRNQPVPCISKPPEGIIIGRNGRKQSSNTMSAADADAIIVLSPRSTRLMDARPVLHWTSLAEATAYKVTVRGEEGSWSVNVPAVPGRRTQELTYPPPCTPDQTTGCAPPLKPGHTYKLVVEANGRSSEEEDLPGLGFSLLSEAEAHSVRKQVEEIDRLPVAQRLKTYMRASVYLHHKLNSQAINLLQASPDTPRNPEAVRLLGDLYLNVALTREAEAQYLSLLKPPLVNLDTPAGAAVTSQTLGEIYEQLGNTVEAVKYYTEAQKLFQKAGNKEAGDLVGGRLKSLTSP